MTANEHAPGHCQCCGVDVRKAEFYRTVNPEGGYGLPEFLVCEPCVWTDQWADWRARHEITPDNPDGRHAN